MRILIWGKGRLAAMVVGRFIDEKNIVGYIDNDNSKKMNGGGVYHPSEINNLDYDAICVANLYSKEIYQQCIDLDIDLKKVIFLYANCSLSDMNSDYDFIKTVLGEEFATIVKNRYHVVRGVEAYGDLFLNDSDNLKGYSESDYVRIKTFELVVKEIRKSNTQGEVAEVGVFRGEFAQYINNAFPTKKCYLFDTFEGFDAKEALKEKQAGNCTNTFVEAYKQTNVDMVLNRMTYLNNVIIKQGLFPESLDGLEETFAFVSIDVDFEDSIYEGLKYFYPRLSKGGYIFVHDYNSSLRGVEKAVDRYEKDNRLLLHKVPLCDANGTLVIMGK